MKKLNESNKLAIRMLIAMIGGILAGLILMAVREMLGNDSAVWTTINSFLFQDITAAGGESAWVCSTSAASCLSGLCS